MKIEVIRDTKAPTFTLGKFYIDGKQEYFVCEDAVRAEKIKYETAIPSGKYQVLVTPSERFGRLMPILKDVPGFTGVRIHSGNFAGDTAGCLLIGMQRLPNGVGLSREAFNDFFPRLLRGLDEGKVWLTIK